MITDAPDTKGHTVFRLFPVCAGCLVNIDGVHQVAGLRDEGSKRKEPPVSPERLKRVWLG
jgi:hypothetical protein